MTSVALTLVLKVCKNLLISVTSDYALLMKSHLMLKDCGVVFPSKEIKVSSTPSIFLSGTKIKFSD